MATSDMIWLAVLGVVVLAGVVLALARKLKTDAKFQEIAELIGDVLDILKRQARDQLADVPLDAVEAVATSIYRKYVQDTTLAKFMTEQWFVELVIERWKKLLEVETATVAALELRAAVMG